LKNNTNYANFIESCWSSQAQILLVKKLLLAARAVMKGFADAASGKMNGFPKAAVVDNLPPIFVDCLQRL
jgi:hypothetical protein